MRSVSKWRCWKKKGIQHVFVKCPGCGQEYRLEHDISALGVVSPSLECPSDRCTFHDNVILVGWLGGAISV